MRHYLTLLLIACGLTSFAQQNINHTLTHQDQTRKFIVHLPPNYSASIDYAMVFVLHGGGLGTGAQIQNNSKMDAVADAEKFIVVYPDALNENWADGRDNPSDDAGVDDIGFVGKMIDFVNANYSIDVERVFSCGMSNGAFMSHRLAMELSNRIAAIGAVAGTMGLETASLFPPANPVPLIEFHGTNDNYVPYNGGAVVITRGEALPVEEVVNMYAGYNGCDATPVKTVVPNTNKLDLCTAERYDYTNCDNGNEVVFYKIIRGGHTWPGGGKNFALGATNQDISASVEIWNFFKNKRRLGAPQLTSISDRSLITYPNPAQNALEFSWKGSDEVTVMDASGKVCAFSWIDKTSDNKKIDVSNLAPGLYFLKISDKTSTFRILR